MAGKQLLAGVLVLGALALGGISPAAAAGTKTYTNATHGYSMSYPANWKAHAKYQGQDVGFVAPDKATFVTAYAVQGTATAKEIKDQQSKVLMGLGTPEGTLAYKTRKIGGVTFETSAITTKLKDGTVLDVALADGIHNGYLYDFEIVVKDAAKTAATEANQGINIVTSVKFLS